MAPAHVPAPPLRDLLSPLLPALPAAAFSTQPAPAVLRLLSPILRQRVRLFASSSNEPWLRLLCYDTEKGVKLRGIARSGDLEPHPVSGEVEVDWDYDVETRYRRLDKETIQALVVVKPLGLTFQLVHCTGDQEGGGDGWRVGEVSVPDKPSSFSLFGGMSSLADAESDFVEKEAVKKAIAENPVTGGSTLGVGTWHSSTAPANDDDDDENDYWARYDATPARTPATKRSPAPAPMQQSTHSNGAGSAAAEDAYFSQYDSVQPAMDNHDPDEEAAAASAGIKVSSSHATARTTAPQPANKYAAVVPPLGLSAVSNSQGDVPMSADADETSRVWTMVEKETRSMSSNEDRVADLVHPRPASSSSSNGSAMVAKLEESAERKDSSEFGIKQHVGRTVRSLFSLSRAAGIDRQEFERLVKTELDLLGVVEDQERI
ncbi:hypothetical protein MKZ38_006189 [Zalerion maritima]|uniref:Uncharacterized protein n=1 Tax=Zalerion maritima TaxID=339359 RepID=A0AAD5RJ54_9PEZI|nr:hypothetical protein MKZ38_006189 [Zalerion maritima]